MKKYKFYDYSECKKAKAIEDLLNDCGSPKSHLEKLKAYFNDSELGMALFFMSCVAYWGESDRYDERNKFAVLTSRKIVEHFEDFTDLASGLQDEWEKEAYAFTLCAHRYLQNELFKAILYFWEQNKTDWDAWLKEEEFVYNSDGTDLVPYRTVRGY